MRSVRPRRLDLAMRRSHAHEEGFSDPVIDRLDRAMVDAGGPLRGRRVDEIPARAPAYRAPAQRHARAPKQRPTWQVSIRRSRE
jgi:hypothetical protein